MIFFQNHWNELQFLLNVTRIHPHREHLSFNIQFRSYDYNLRDTHNVDTREHWVSMDIKASVAGVGRYIMKVSHSELDSLFFFRRVRLTS